MDANQLRSRCPSAQFECAAALKGHRLAFTRFSRKRQCGVADFVSDVEAYVWGGVFHIAEADLDGLDRSEGTHLLPPAYRRIRTEVLSTNQWLDVFTYEVVDKASDHVKPNAVYMALIIGGAVKCGLPPPYIDKLKQIEVC